jgi:hypothetical protein
MKFTPFVACVAGLSLLANTALAGTVKIPEGTEFRLRLEDRLSTKTSAEGDRFTVTLVDDVPLADGTTLKAGYRGVGEIVHLKKNGRVGKKGELNVRLNYLRVGDERIKLRASKGAQGGGNTGGLIVGIALVGVFGLLVKGKSAEIPKGTQFAGFADTDSELGTPFAPPPPEAL